MSAGDRVSACLPTLVIIPGTLCDKRLFEVQRRKLRGLAHVVLVEYTQLTCVGSWARELLTTLPDKFSLAGFSLGGIWALEILRLAPHRVDRLALIASNAQAASARGKRRSRAMRRQWTQAGASSLVRPLMNAYFHSIRAKQKYQGLIESMAVQTQTPSALAQFEWAANRPDGHQNLSRFAGPVLIVSGAKDAICQKSWQQSMLYAHPTATWVELPRVGHFLPLEAPAKLHAHLLRWMLNPATA